MSGRDLAAARGRDGHKAFIRESIERLRPRLLDFSRLNPLIATRLAGRSGSYIRAVDELPDVLCYGLTEQQRRFRFKPLPPLDDDPRDEADPVFQAALAEARLTDEAYAQALEALDPADDLVLVKQRQAERALRDRVRARLGMAPRQRREELSLVQHARNNGINPRYDLPRPDDSPDDGRHTDADIQTLLLPEDLQRTATRLTAKCRSWQQETGLNVMHAAFGFLEWHNAAGEEQAFAPLVLVPAQMRKEKTRDGPVFRIEGTGEAGEMNTVLAEKLRREASIRLPAWNGVSVEDYLAEVAAAAPAGHVWRVRRYVAFGVFPSARMAMYQDLDTARPNFTTNPIVDELLGGTTPDPALPPFAEDYHVDQPAVEATVPLLVTEADSSQFSALVDIAAGKNLAVEGPPGTGKSQTIVNAIAAALAAGKSVLFVAEKTAALDVVRSRLEHMKLGEFVLPLQAGRSSREQVVASIRDRITIAAAAKPRDYKNQVAAFRSVRDEIAHYIATVSRRYRNTGFTVHDILGRSILTGGCLDGLPRSLQSPEVTSIRDLDRHRIAAIKEEARRVETAWRQAAAAAGHWRAVQLDGLDRFAADDLLERADQAAMRYAALDTACRALAAFGISADADADAIAGIRHALAALAALPDQLDAALVRSLAVDGRQAELEVLLADCQLCRDRRETLSLALTPPFDHELADLLRHIHRTAVDCDFVSLDVAELNRQREALAASIRRGEAAARELSAFLAEMPDFGDLPTTALATARRLIDATPREVLASRSAAAADPGAAPLIMRAMATGCMLKHQREELAERFIVDRAPTAEELFRHVAALRRSWFPGLLSADRRAAQRAYRMLARGRPNRAAAERLAELAIWKSEVERFEAGRTLPAALGLNFNGIDTDFARVQRLLDFYDEVDRTLPGVALRKLRGFLKTADLDLLQALPEIPADAPQSPCCDFEAALEGQRQTLVRVEQGLAGLAAPLQRIRVPQIGRDMLPDLAAAVDTHAGACRAVEIHRMGSLLGARFAGIDTAAQDCAAELAAAAAVREHPRWAELLCSLLAERRIAPALAAATAWGEAHAAAAAAVATLCQRALIEPGQFLPAGTAADIAAFLRAAAQDREGLHRHAEYRRALSELAPTGMAKPVQALLEGGHGLAGLPDILEAMIVRALAMAVYSDHGGELARFTGTTLDELRRRLGQLDKEILEAAQQHLRATLIKTAAPPAGNGTGPRATWTELALLKHVIGLQRNRCTARDLVQRAGRALLAYKPCWMMSPLAIAQYLPPSSVEFDLCIIDEASQMPPENAIGALLRARQVMVVGDTNQLPPTSFFRKLVDDDDDDDGAEAEAEVVEESILEIANAVFRPPRRLRWHYRSRHSALIRFSNRMIYDDDLIVFPSPGEDRADMGVSLVPVTGVYKSGTNSAEAAAIIEAAVTFMREQPHRSLGIVTLNRKQRELIEAGIEQASRNDSCVDAYRDRWGTHRDGLESFFVKNLENVQGDERDVIFIGTVYGPEQPGGKVHQRFGPINGVAGRRRLNVLFSRAKQQIVTFSSMTASNIVADETGNPGAYMLKRWLEYAATGVLDAGEATGREPDSDFEVYVAQQIRAMGCQPVHQVGVAGYFIDIGIRHPAWPHGYLLGVECDGAAYHSARSARDRDRLRQEVLEGLGWHLHRIWSTDWFNNPRAEAERLRRRIAERLAEEQAMAAAAPAAPVAEPPAAPAAPVSEPPAAAAPVPGEAAMDQGVPDAAAAAGAGQGIAVGDTVRVRYLTGDKATLLVTLSDTANDPANGVIHVSRPLAQALLGAELHEQVEVLVGSRVQLAEIESVRKAAPA